MATVIKASDSDRASQAATFNFDDMNRQAERYVADVHTRARQIVAQAEAEAAAVRRRAEDEGRAAAEKKFAAQVEVRVAERMKVITPAVQELVAQLAQAREAWIAHWEQAAVKLAAGIAERIVRRELTRHPEISQDWLREALQLAGGSAEVRISLHPGDLAALGPQAESLAREFSRVGQAQVLADPQVSSGGCRVDTQFGVIDQRLETQLARIVEELI